MSYKFDEASYKDNNGNIIEPPLKLEYLIAQKKKNEKLFEQKYYRRLFCPECHAPQLSLVASSNGVDFFLRGFKNQAHTNNCSYSFDSVSNAAITKLLDDRKSSKFVNAKLKGLVNKLFKKKILEYNPFLVKVEHGRVSANDVNNHDLINRQIIKRLPTKSLTSPFDENDYNVPKLFYGNVDIKFFKRKKELDNSFFYAIDVYFRETNKKICSISMSSGVFSNLKIPFTVEYDVRYTNVLMAVATVLIKKDSYIDGRITYSDYCVIDVIQAHHRLL